MVSAAYEVPESRIVLPDSLLASRYDVSVTLPYDSDENYRAVLRQVVIATFGSMVHRESREIDVYVLRRRSSVPAPVPSEHGRPLQSLTRLAENLLGCPVPDETGLQGRYEFVPPPGRQPLFDAVRDLSLELVPARRSIELLVANVQQPM